MGLFNSNSEGLVRFSKARLVGGTVPQVHRDGYVLLMDKNGVGFGTGIQNIRWHVRFFAESIVDSEVIGVESRLTVTRMATLGLAGAGLKRNRTWVRLTDESREAVFEVRADERQTRAWMSQFAWARRATGGSRPSEIQHPASLVDQLAKLADLREQGVLSNPEFEAAKGRLLTE